MLLVQEALVQNKTASMTLEYRFVALSIGANNVAEAMAKFAKFVFVFRYIKRFL